MNGQSPQYRTPRHWTATDDGDESSDRLLPRPDNSPKSAAGVLKTPHHLVPTVAVEREAWVFALGARKYGKYNWRETGVAATVYYDAARRHLDAWLDGEDNDPESGISHLAHARACLGILLDVEAGGMLIDDRPPACPRVD